VPIPKDNFLRPFIRWAGGKQNLVHHLLEQSPPEGSFNKYWEPFLGAGSLFFANGFKKAELSDVNKHLINAYNQIKINPEPIYKRLLAHKRKVSTDYYYEVREKYNNHLNDATIEQAARFIFLVHTCYNGMYRVNGNGEYNVPFGKSEPSLPSFEHLKKVSKKLKNIPLKVHPYDSIYDKVKRNDFIYLDPPYPKLNQTEQFQQFTIDKFSEDHQRGLAKFAEHLNVKGCKVMISNSKVPLIAELYANWNIVEVPVVRYVSCKKERKKINELIIKNY
jgi:DNA adenine methylase